MISVHYSKSIAKQYFFWLVCANKICRLPVRQAVLLEKCYVRRFICWWCSIHCFSSHSFKGRL